jgi:hypothetical protein
MRREQLLTTLLGGLWLVSACTSTGNGSGQVRDPAGQQAPVTFRWQSTDGGMSGTMTALLPGALYEGRFFQITRQVRGEALDPLWMHWRSGWYDWPYWSRPLPAPLPTTAQFLTYYSGKVVATLESAGQPHMRCRFHLAAPARGLSGGGEGECQLSDGRGVQAVFVEPER